MIFILEKSPGIKSNLRLVSFFKLKKKIYDIETLL